MISTMPVLEPASGRARWSASLRDYLVIAGWIAVVTVAGALVRALLVPDVGGLSLLGTDVLAFSLTVLPVWGYLTVAEAGVRQATWGKRRAGLRVVAADGGRPGRWRTGLRNLVKLLPWQLAHLAVARLILTVDAPTVIVITYALSLLIPLVSIGTAARDPQRRALHDRVARTRVVHP